MKKRFGIFVLTMFAVGLVGCGTGSDKTMTETSTSTEQSAENVEKEEKKMEAETESESEVETEPAETEAQPHALGETITLGDWSITASAMNFSKTISVNELMQYTADEGNQYLVVTGTVTNQAKQAESFLPSFNMGTDVSAKVIFGDGYEFSNTMLVGYDRSLADASLNPLSSKEGDIAFEVPESVVNSTESLTLIFELGEEQVSYQLR